MTQHESDELLALFKEEYADFEEAQEILKGIKEDLKSAAERIKVEPRAVMSAWNMFKKYASGKVTAGESNDTVLLESIVVDYFTANREEDI